VALRRWLSVFFVRIAGSELERCVGEDAGDDDKDDAGDPNRRVENLKLGFGNWAVGVKGGLPTVDPRPTATYDRKNTDREECEQTAERETLKDEQAHGEGLANGTEGWRESWYRVRRVVPISTSKGVH